MSESLERLKGHIQEQEKRIRSLEKVLHDLESSHGLVVTDEKDALGFRLDFSESIESLREILDGPALSADPLAGSVEISLGLAKRLRKASQEHS